MSLDDLLFAIIIIGIGLSGAHLRAELVSHRRMTALRRAREFVQREVHAKRVGFGHNTMPTQPAPSIQANPFPLVRVLARALRIFIQERNIHRFWIRTSACLKRNDEPQVTWHAPPRPQDTISLSIEKESTLCAPAGSPPTVYSKKSESNIGTVRHRELA
jgi:hypothetical protein